MIVYEDCVLEDSGQNYRFLWIKLPVELRSVTLNSVVASAEYVSLVVLHLTVP